MGRFYEVTGLTHDKENKTKGLDKDYAMLGVMEKMKHLICLFQFKVVRRTGRLPKIPKHIKHSNKTMCLVQIK